MNLKSRRLILRPIRLSEAPFYFENASRSEVDFAAGILPPKSVAFTRGQGFASMHEVLKAVGFAAARR